MPTHPRAGELREIARAVVLAVAAGSLPEALRERLAGAALLLGADAGEVARLLGNGPHAVAVALRLAGNLLLWGEEIGSERRS